MNKHYSFLFCCLLLSLVWQSKVIAQDYLWSKNLADNPGQTLDYNVDDIKTDSEGNVYAIGNFRNTIKFGNTTFSVQSSSIFVREGFLVKYDKDGAVLWARKMRGDGNVEPTAIAIDKDDAVYLVGNYSGDSLILNNGNTVFINTVDNFSQGNVFALKYHKDGTFAFGEHVVSTAASFDEANDIEVDEDKNYYITGLFQNNIKFDNEELDGSGLSSELFLAKYDSNSVAQWAVEAVNNNPFFSNRRRDDIKVRNDTVYWASVYRTSATIDGSSTSSATNLYGIFLAKLNIDNGDLHSIGSLASDASNLNTLFFESINDFFDVDDAGNIYFAFSYGSFSTSQGVVVGGDTLNAFGIEDGVIAKLDADLEKEWIQEIRGGSRLYISEMIYKNDNLYINGYFIGQTIIQGDTLFYSQNNGGFQYDSYVLKMDNRADLYWIDNIPGGGNEYARDVAVDNQQNTFIAGNFTNSIILGNDTIRAGTINNNRFLAKIDCTPFIKGNISGDNRSCIESKSYSIDAFSSDTYLWTLNGGGTLSAAGGSATVNWTDTGSYTLTVTPSSSCGTGTPKSINVRVLDIPSRPTISGDTAVCTNTLSAFSVVQQPEETYAWNKTGIGSLNPLDNLALADWDFLGDYQISATPSNFCGTGPTASLDVRAEPEPAQPNGIIGVNSVCLGSSTYTVDDNQSGVEYIWNLSSGGTLSASGKQATINWSEPGIHTVSVSAKNGCNTSASRFLNVNVRQAPAQPSTINGSNRVCKGQNLIYSIIDQQSNVNYSWDLTGGGTLTPSGSGKSATVSWVLPGTYDITVTPSNDCGNGTPVTISVEVFEVPSRPTTIAGLSSVCKGNQIYSVTQQPTVNYTWALTGGGVIVPNGNQASINWSDSGTYTLTVTPANFCGTGSSLSRLITVSGSTSQFATISGEDSACINEENYSVPFVAGLGYNWSLSSGGTIVSTNVNNCRVDWTTAGEHRLDLLTSDGCAVSLPVDVAQIPAKADTLLGADTVCSGSFNYSVSAVEGVTYNWSLSAGGTLTPFANLATVAWDSAGTFTLENRLQNRCGTSPAVVKNINVTRAALQPGNISGDDTVCTSLIRKVYSVPSQGAGVNFQWSLSGGGILTQLGNQAEVIWIDTGSHELSVIARNNCNTSGRQSLQVRVNRTPERAEIVGSPNVCLGDSVGYAVLQPKNDVAYNWSLPSGGLLETNGAAAGVDWIATGFHTLRVTPTNACGDGLFDTVRVRVNAAPTTSFSILGDTLLCPGGSETYQTSITNTAGLSFSWNLDGGGSLTPLSQNAFVVWTTPGVHNLSVTPANFCGPAPTEHITVKVLSQPTQPSLISGKNNTCLQEEEYAISPRPDESYIWSLQSGGTLTANGDSATVIWDNTGVHLLTVTASNACGVTSPRSLQVQVSDIPDQPTFTAFDPDICISSQNYGVFNQQGVTFNWLLSGGGTLTPSGANAVVNWSTAGNHTLSVFGQNLCGSGDTNSVSVDVNQVPAQPALISGPANSCIETQNYSTTDVFGVDYTWSLTSGGGIIPNGASVNVSWLSPGRHTLSVTPSNECGSGAPRLRTVEVKTLPAQPTPISGEPTVCLGNTDSYSVTDESDVTYTWSINGGGSLTPNAEQTEVSWNNTGTYTLSVLPSNFCGDGPSRTLQITVKDLPEAPVFSNTETGGCLGSQTNYAVLNNPELEYNWQLSEGGQLNTLRSQANVVWDSTGMFDLHVSASNLCGTGDSSVVAVEVLQSPSRPDSIFGDTLSCIGSTPYRVDPQPNTEYNWILGSGGSIAPADNEVEVTWITGGTHTLRVQASNRCGTAPSQLLPVKVATLQKPEEIVGDQFFCEGQTANFFVPLLDAENDTEQYFWDVVGAGSQPFTQDRNRITVVWDQAANYSITVVRVNNCGQTRPTFKTAVVSDEPDLADSIVGKEVTCIGSTVAYSVTKNDLAEDYFWDASSGELAFFGNSAVMTWTEAGTQQISVFASNFCGDGAPLTKTVEIETPPTQPTISTNGEQLISSAPAGNQWYRDGTPIEGATGQTYTPAERGVYTVEVTNTCTTSEQSVGITFTDKTLADYGIRTYPIPARDLLYLELPYNLVWTSIVLTDGTGRKVAEIPEATQDYLISLNVSQLPSGLYVVTFNTETGSVSGKIIVD